MKGLLKKRSIFFLLMWIVFVSLWPLFSRAEKKGLKLIREGEALFKETNYEDAMKKFQEAARDYIYTDTNWLRLYKNKSRVYYVLGKEKESVDYIMKVLEIEINARLRGKGEIAPGYRVLFLRIQRSLKNLIKNVKSLTERKLFSKARQELEKAVKFKGHKKVEELKNDIKEAEKKYKRK